ncbi:MAG: hypothetical protein NTW21_22640 [Verrucomicrobia bacterium]|nr:hypothetical protein [Verrucomicrobiota bacterium]
MQRNTTIIAGTAVLWLGTLTGAFYLGRNHDPSHGGSASSGPFSAAESSGGNSAGRNNREGRSSRDREPEAKPLTVKQILAKMKATMRGGAMQNPASMMKVMGLLDKIRPQDVQEVLAEAAAMTDPQQKMMLSMCLLAKWAE